MLIAEIKLKLFIYFLIRPITLVMKHIVLINYYYYHFKYNDRLDTDVHIVNIKHKIYGLHNIIITAALSLCTIVPDYSTYLKSPLILM